MNSDPGSQKRSKEKGENFGRLNKRKGLSKTMEQLTFSYVRLTIPLVKQKT
jgi:hypothetical protein